MGLKRAGGEEAEEEEEEEADGMSAAAAIDAAIDEAATDVSASVTSSTIGVAFVIGGGAGRWVQKCNDSCWSLGARARGSTLSKLRVRKDKCFSPGKRVQMPRNCASVRSMQLRWIDCS